MTCFQPKRISRHSFGLLFSLMLLAAQTVPALAASELRRKPMAPPADPHIQLRGWLKQNPKIEWIGTGTITEVHVNKISARTASRWQEAITVKLNDVFYDSLKARRSAIQLLEIPASPVVSTTQPNARFAAKTNVLFCMPPNGDRLVILRYRSDEEKNKMKDVVRHWQNNRTDRPVEILTHTTAAEAKAAQAAASMQNAMQAKDYKTAWKQAVILKDLAQKLKQEDKAEAAEKYIKESELTIRRITELYKAKAAERNREQAEILYKGALDSHAMAATALKKRQKALAHHHLSKLKVKIADLNNLGVRDKANLLKVKMQEIEKGLKILNETAKLPTPVKPPVTDPFEDEF